MTSQTRATNTALFENGDQPSGTNYRDLIDSYVGLIDATAQSMTSNLTVPTLIASVVCANTLFADNVVVGGFAGPVSADNGLTVSGATRFNAVVSANAGMDVSGAASFKSGVTIEGTTSAAGIFADSLTISGTTSAAGLFADSLRVAGAARFSTIVSADAGMMVSGVARFTTVCAQSIFADSFVSDNSHGHLYITAATATNTSAGVTNTFIKAKAETTAHNLTDVSATDNRLTYIGVDTKTFLITISVGASSSNNNHDFSIGVGKNGSILVGSDVQRFFAAAGGNMAAMSTNYVTTMDNDDFVELMVTSDAASQSTIHKLSFALVQI